MPEQSPEHSGTIQRSNEIVTEYAETHVRDAGKRVDKAVKRGKSLEPKTAEEIVNEYNEWNEFVRPKSPNSQFYEVRKKRGKAQIISSED